MTRTILVAGARGGVGATTVALLAAMHLAGSGEGARREVAVVDARGDLADMLSPAPGPAALDLSSGPSDVLAAAVPAGDLCTEVRVICPDSVKAAVRRRSGMSAGVVVHLSDTLIAAGMRVLVDVGRVDGALAAELQASEFADCSRLLVADNEFVSVQRAHAWRHWADAGIVLVNERNRPLSARDFAAIAGVPAVVVEHSASVQSCTNAGVLGSVDARLRRQIQEFGALDETFGIEVSGNDDHLSVLN